VVFPFIAAGPRLNLYAVILMNGDAAGGEELRAPGPSQRRSGVSLAQLATARPTIPGRRNAQVRAAGCAKEWLHTEIRVSEAFDMRSTRQSRRRRKTRWRRATFR
jgi:hypothetical protein